MIPVLGLPGYSGMRDQTSKTNKSARNIVSWSTMGTSLILH